MYSKDFVVSIVVDKQIVEEDRSGTIVLPEGTEYSVRLRNKNNRRAVASLFIDDKDVGHFVVQPNNFVNIQRPVDAPYKFKLVSADAAEVGKRPRSDGANGVVRVEWRLEKAYEAPIPKVVEHHHHHYSPWPIRPISPWCGYSYVGGSGQQEELCRSSVDCNFAGLNFTDASEGCTVPGQVSEQSFTYVNLTLEECEPVVIQLILKVGKQGRIPAVVTQERFCANCGRKSNRKTDKFCTQCGRRL